MQGEIIVKKEQLAKEAAVELILEGNTNITEEQLKELLIGIHKNKKLTIKVSFFIFALYFVDIEHTSLIAPKLFSVLLLII